MSRPTLLHWQDVLNKEGGPDACDASGNPILKDVGTWLRSQFKAHFKDADIKYISPTYMIRSVPATSNDRWAGALGGRGSYAALGMHKGAAVLGWRLLRHNTVLADGGAKHLLARMHKGMHKAWTCFENARCPQLCFE